jgi:hypothetical protein
LCHKYALCISCKVRWFCIPYLDKDPGHTEAMAHEHKGVECWKTHRDGGRNFHQQPTWFMRMRNTDLDDGRDEVKWHEDVHKD